MLPCKFIPNGTAHVRNVPGFVSKLGTAVHTSTTPSFGTMPPVRRPDPISALGASSNCVLFWVIPAKADLKVLLIIDMCTTHNTHRAIHASQLPLLLSLSPPASNIVSMFMSKSPFYDDGGGIDPKRRRSKMG